MEESGQAAWQGLLVAKGLTGPVGRFLWGMVTLKSGWSIS